MPHSQYFYNNIDYFLYMQIFIGFFLLNNRYGYFSRANWTFLSICKTLSLKYEVLYRLFSRLCLKQ